jgi:hypothetical protein
MFVCDGNTQIALVPPRKMVSLIDHAWKAKLREAMRLEVISDQTYCCVYIDDDNGGTTTCDTFNTKEEAIARRAQLTHPIGHVFQVCDVLRDVNVKMMFSFTEEFARDANRHDRAQVPSLSMAVQCRGATHTLDFLVDTGSEMSILSVGACALFGIHLENLPHNVRVRDINGGTQDCGSARVRIGGQQIQFACHPSSENLLGADLLLWFTIFLNRLLDEDGEAVIQIHICDANLFNPRAHTSCHVDCCRINEVER